MKTIARPAPGELGEICGYGRLVMEGYHNRPDATLEATWTDPEGRRWLRTGDIGRLDDEGFLYLVDRKKDMILSGSQNVYPADIELMMLQHPSVREVAVIGIPSKRWGETPLAIVVACPGEHVTTERTRGVDQQPRRQAAAHLRRRVRRRLAAQPQWEDPQARIAQALRASGGLELMAHATEHYYSSADGLRLYYKDYETEAAGKLPVLCLPGLTRNSRDFEHVALRLQRDRRVLCADLRGRGRSQHDPNWQNYHPGAYVADILLLLADAGVPRCVLLGTSLGGILSMMISATYPALVGGVILNDVGPEVAPEGLARICVVRRSSLAAEKLG